jgi:hypothetical protein
MWRCLGIFVLGALVEVRQPSFLESPELGLGVHCTPSLDELAFSMVGLDRPTNGRLHTCLSNLFLSEG